MIRPSAPGGHGGQGQRLYQPADAGGMAGIYDDRQMGQLFQNWHCGNVKSVSGVGFVGADAPLTEDNLSLPPAIMYSALIRSSSMVEDRPLFRRIGLSSLPSSFNSSKFCMFRAPTWMISTSSNRECG